MGHIIWAPDGSCIAYEWVEGPPDQPLTYEGLRKVSSDGKERAELYASGAPEKGVALLAGWSLDGQHILFWQGSILSVSLLSDRLALYSLPADGGEPIELVDSVLVHDDFVAPAPQGDWLAVAAGYWRATWTNKRVAVVGVGGGELTRLTDESVAAFSPAWSPDGVRLAYVAMPDRGDLGPGVDKEVRLGMMERHIWVINAQGKPQPQQLTVVPEGFLVDFLPGGDVSQHVLDGPHPLWRNSAASTWTWVISSWLRPSMAWSSAWRLSASLANVSSLVIVVSPELAISYQPSAVRLKLKADC